MPESGRVESGVQQDFHMCEVVCQWEEGAAEEDLVKCVNEAVGKFEFETQVGTHEEWLCEDHRDDYEIVRKIEVLN